MLEESVFKISHCKRIQMALLMANPLAVTKNELLHGSKCFQVRFHSFVQACFCLHGYGIHKLQLMFLLQSWR
jgi:hypothetical protein